MALAADFRICPATGLKVHLPAERLIKANAVVAVVFLAIGGLFGLPIINQPQVAILGIGGIQKRPVVIDDAIAIRSMMYIAMSYDHRVVDGAVADQFLAHVKSTLERFDEALL